MHPRGKKSAFVRQRGFECAFRASESWVILSPIEQSIKRKIEAVGVPLKDWDVSINYGIKTGCNEAFIIDKERREEILSWCKTAAERKKTDELIRPILRGRDIKRYGYDWAGLYLIATHNGIPEKGIPRIDIKDYPAIKRHLDQYWDKISVRADMGDTPYNLRSCAYMDDFPKPKILYPDIMRMPQNEGALPNYPRFHFDGEGFYPEATLFLILGEDLEALTAFLCSDVGFFVFSKIYSGPQFDTTGFRYKKEYLETLPVIHSDKHLTNCSKNTYEHWLIGKLLLTTDEMDFIRNYKATLLKKK